ncbi:SufE family protein [Bacteriovoracaceae bacterium]|nr:SufE family protein [Bacteriovoracaceae bacterium]
MNTESLVEREIMSIESKANDIINKFSQFDKWEDRYREIINIGKIAPNLTDDEKQEKFLVKGCQSQVWLLPHFENGKIFFTADSDSFLVKGIIIILVQVYSNSTLDEVLNYKDDFLSKIGISEHLSMNRTNGLASMLKQIKLYALAYKATQK